MKKIENSELRIPEILLAHNLSKNVEIEYKLFKLIEELGEANKAILKRSNTNNCSKTAEDNIEEELVDIFLTTVDIILCLIDEEHKESFFNEREFLLDQILNIKNEEFVQGTWFKEEVHTDTNLFTTFASILNSLTLEYYNIVVQFLALNQQLISYKKNDTEEDEQLLENLQLETENKFQDSIKISTILIAFIIFHFETKDLKDMLIELLNKKINKWLTRARIKN